MKVDLSPEQERIIKHFAKAMGFSMEEAVLHWLINAMVEWYPVIQREYPLYEVKQNDLRIKEHGF